jgi:iron complex outermembrane receptor protein
MGGNNSISTPCAQPGDDRLAVTLRRVLLGGAASGALLAAAVSPAMAQSASTGAGSAADAAAIEEIVVTGTLIKGVAPVGTQVLSVSQEQIKDTGVASTNNLLASMPLVSTFNTVASTPSDLGNQANRPNIRGISTGQYDPALTLLLLDGHNMVGASILQTTPDPTMIPPGAVERVEVVPDGASSLYGSDAVSGIVNFITRKRFDGTEISAHRGFANSYDSADFSITHGIDWEGGSAVLSFFNRYNSELMAGDRDFPRQDLTPYGGVDNRTRNCNPATITANGTTYALPAGTPPASFAGLQRGTFNLCDSQQAGNSIVPKEHQNSFFASMQHEISPSIHFEATGYYANRLTKTPEPQQAQAGARIDASNPFFRPIAGEASQTVAFSYAAAYGPSFISQSRLRSWGFTPKVDWDLNENWNVEALFNYGFSEMILHDPKVNAVYQTSVLSQAPGSGITLTRDTALNPYDVTQTNPQVLQGILNWDNYAIARQKLTQGRLVTNGTLFNAPGGEVRLALGGQISREYYNALNVDAPFGSTLGAATKEESRNVYAVFGELLVPLVGPDNARPGLRSFAIDLSARYDKYDNCCETSNPKIGVTYEPFEGLSIRGNWGTSFNAPSMADMGGAVDTRVSVGQTTSINNLRPGDSNPAVDTLRPSMSVPGGNPDLQPQEATTWSIGADFSPPSVPQLRASLTYWNVALSKSIGTSTMPIQQKYITPEWSKYYIVKPTLEQALAAFGGLQNTRVQGAASIASLYGNGNDPYLLNDLRRHNLGNQYVDGIDWTVSYYHLTGFGQINGAISANYILNRESEPVEGAARVDLLATNNRQLTLSANIGVEVGAFRAGARLNYSGGYPVIGVPNQTKVKAFHPLNMYMAYAFDGPGLLRDTEVTLNIDNVFNINPPFINSGSGYANGSTLGRYVNVGLRKRF